MPYASKWQSYTPDVGHWYCIYDSVDTFNQAKPMSRKSVAAYNLLRVVKVTFFYFTKKNPSE